MYFLILHIQLISLILSADISNDAMQSLRCELGISNDDFCPIDGGWTSWSAWSSCSGECGSKGKKMRSRSCSNPSPSNNGAPCIGANYQTNNCQITGCTIDDYEKVAHNHPVRQEEMKIVKMIHEKLPALAELCFSVDCTFSIVKKILDNDAMIYWNAMNCVKYGIGCPIPGGWSHWEAWLPCTALCGRGEAYRLRTCNSPKPSDSELSCDGLPFESKPCTGFNCLKHSTAGTWGDWDGWSSCSVSCGTGVRIRKRSCIESKTIHSKKLGEQGTSCEGSAKDLEPCEINDCSVDSEWSPWSVWTTCSSNCGVGTQMRNRICNNPFPSYNATTCSGLASEVRQCFNKPCFVRSHEVAYFSGESSLLYGTSGKTSRLLHIYLRFLPLSPFGILLHRLQRNCNGLMCDFIKLHLRNGKIVLLSQISGCTSFVVQEDKLEIGTWHEILLLICGTYVMLRINNGPHKIGSFSCIPISHNLDHLMTLGEGFHGQIQKMAINFAAIQLRLPKGALEGEDGYIPTSSNNMQYFMGDAEEGFLHIDLTESLAAPCPKHNVTIAMKTEDINGVIAIIPGDFLNKYILLMLEEGRIKLKFHQGTLYATIESTEHISTGEWFEMVLTQDNHRWYMQINENKKNYIPSFAAKTKITCVDNMFIGAVREETKKKACPKCGSVPQMSFTVGYLEIDGIEIDLLSLPALETTNNRFASRTVSFSDYYEEVTLLLGQQLKLACFYDKIPHEQKIRSKFFTETYVTWLLIDTPLHYSGKTSDFFTLKDNGRVSSISAASYNSRKEIEHFYSCYIRRYKNTTMTIFDQALFTFGVTIIDENREFGTVHWKKWSCIFGTILICLMFMIVWYVLEALWDFRNGYGFYRLPRIIKNSDSTSVVNFILSAEGVTLLGNQQAADEVAEKVIENNQTLEPKVNRNGTLQTDLP